MPDIYGWRTMSAGSTKSLASIEKRKWQKKYPRRKFRLHRLVGSAYLVQMYGKMLRAEARSDWSNVTRDRR